MSEMGEALLVYGVDLGSWEEIQPQLDAKQWPYGGGTARGALESGMEIFEFLNMQLIGEAGKFDEYTALDHYDQRLYLDSLKVQAIKYGDEDSNGVMLAAKVFRGAGIRYAETDGPFKAPYWEPTPIRLPMADVLSMEMSVRRAVKYLGIAARASRPDWMLAHLAD